MTESIEGEDEEKLKQEEKVIHGNTVLDQGFLMNQYYLPIHGSSL